MERKHYLYLVASQTGSIVSRAIRCVTHAAYNHVSISLDEDLNTLYSFARRVPWFPVWGGFVQEHPGVGTLARFPDTTAKVVRVEVTAAQYRAIAAYLMQMYSAREDYHYNYRGVLLAARGRIYRREKHYYCSEFVREVLVRFGVVPEGQFGPIVQPQQLLDELGCGQVIYEGLLNDCPLLYQLPCARTVAA